MSEMSLSNTSLSGIRNAVRNAVLNDFSFYCGNVLGNSYLSETICDFAQHAVASRQNAILSNVAQPNRLAAALHSWLTSQGIRVVGYTPNTRSEVLEWLDLRDQSDGAAETVEIAVLPGAVRLTWL